MRTHTVFGVRVDDVSADEVRTQCLQWLREEGQHVIVTPNPEFLLLARASSRFRALLNDADLSLPDGVGLRFATAALTGERLFFRVTGVETLSMLRGLGARMVTIGGAYADVNPGEVRDALSPEVVAAVAAREPEIIAVGLGQGKQEEIIARHRADWPTARILIGVGGAIDMLHGGQRRAPRVLRAIGLEWLWRFATQPKRWRRILRATVVFPAVVISFTLRERRFLAACKVTIPEIFRQLTAR